MLDTHSMFFKVAHLPSKPIYLILSPPPKSYVAHFPVVALLQNVVVLQVGKGQTKDVVVLPVGTL